MKRFSSGLAVVLGLLGIVLSIVLILSMWIFNSRINKSIASIIQPVETIVSSVDERITSLNSRVQTLQDDVIADLLVKTNAAKIAPPDVVIDTSPILEGIEGRLEPTIEQLRYELSTLAPQVKSTVEVLQVAKSFLPQKAQILIEAKASEQIANSMTSLAETQAKLRQRKTDLSSITINTDIQRMEAIEEPIQEIDSRLTTITTILQGLGTNIDSVQSSVAKTQRRIRLLTILGTLALTLLSLWILWANLALFKNGRRSFREPSSS